MSVTRLFCAKKPAKPIKVLFQVTLGEPSHAVLDGAPDSITAREFDAAFAVLLWPLVCDQMLLEFYINIQPV